MTRQENEITDVERGVLETRNNGAAKEKVRTTRWENEVTDVERGKHPRS